MNFKFILEIILMLALGVILYLFARALPRVSDTDVSPQKELKIHWLSPLLERIDEKLKAFLERLFRRLKVVILKLDNFVSTKLNKFKKEELKEIGLPVEEPSGSENKSQE